MTIDVTSTTGTPRSHTTKTMSLSPKTENALQSAHTPMSETAFIPLKMAKTDIPCTTECIDFLAPADRKVSFVHSIDRRFGPNFTALAPECSHRTVVSRYPREFPTLPARDDALGSAACPLDSARCFTRALGRCAPTKDQLCFSGF